MAHITADRVRQTSTSTGTGTIVLSGSLSGFRTFASVLAVSDTFWYAIASFPGSEWEVGLGTYSALNTITRTTVLASSNAGAAVVFSAGDKEVFITAAASKFLQADAAGSYGNFTAGTITAAQLVSNIATGTAPLTVASTTLVSNLNADLLDGRHLDTLVANLRANRSITGGGTITVDASYNILWNARFIVIANGNGAHFSTSGYFDITCPTSGTITGVGGAVNVTATAAGIPLAAWQALYYILPIGSSATSLAANFRVASYTAALTIPDEWVLIAVRNADTGQGVYFNNGYRLEGGESIDTTTYDAKNADLLDGLHSATANTVSTVVARDASGNFSAGTITAALTGNASTATSLSGGSLGTVPYQSAAGTTAMLAAGTSGYFLKANGVAAPTWAELSLTDIPDAWVKKSARVATTANITLSAPQTIDGIAVIAGDRVLVKDQTTTSQNGIYVVAAAAWSRAADSNTASKIAGAHVNVDIGTANGGLVFDSDFKSTDTLDTTAMVWYRIVDTNYFTTVGNNFARLTNPSAITFPRINADNTVSTLDAANFRTAIGAGTSSTTGTVTSVGGTGTVSGLTLTGTVTTTGNLTLGGTLAVTASNFASQTANTVLAAPNNAAGVPTFRNLSLEDLPDSWAKKSVRAATTANITLSAPQTIDGIAVIAGDRVLVKDQTTQSANGIYVVAAGTWTRSLDADNISELAGACVNVDSGTVNGGIRFDTDLKSTDTLNTTAVTFYKVFDTKDAASTNTASTLVIRDSSGNFSAGTITAALTGAASSNVLKTGDTMTGSLYTRGAFGMKSLSIAGNPTMYDVQEQSGATVLEIGRADNVAATTAIDIHTGATSVDYDTRLEFTGGTGVSGKGSMSILAGSVGINGTAQVGVGSQTEQLQVLGTDGPTCSIASKRYSADATGTQIRGYKSRGATVGTNTAVQSGDGLLSINGYGYTGTQYTAAANINLEADAAPSGSTLQGRITFLTMNSAGSSLERMRINSTGLLSFDSGYGSVAPAYGCRAWVNFDGTAAGTFAGGTSTASRTAGSTTVTVTTTTAHGLITGNRVYVAFSISGVAQGLYTVTNTGTTTFTITTVATTVLSSVAISFVLNNIRGAGNISSVADVSAGYYVMNFATAMPDSNYAILSTVGSGVNPTSRGNDELPFIGEHNQFYATLYVEGADDQAGDKLYMSAAFFR